MTNNIKAVVFDIDGTLVPYISWTRLTLELGSSVPDHNKIYYDFKEGRMTEQEGRRAILKLWLAKGPLSSDKLADIFAGWEIKDGAKDLFSYLRNKGMLTCLVTGSMDLFAKVTAERVGADFWFANTDLIWNEKGYLSDIKYESQAADKKLDQFLRFCSENQIEPKECIAVGDDENDTKLFEACAGGILVESSTSYKLENIAWKKVRSLVEIENIL